MSIIMIAAVGKNNELGKDNRLIWHFTEDMRFFRETTSGKTLVMGRKTFESLPGALPNRRNIVLSAQKDYHAPGAEVIHSLSQALELAQTQDIFIIGGAKIYEQFLPFADELYLTEIDAAKLNADSFFPAFDKNLFEKRVLSQNSENGTNFTMNLYKKKSNA